MLVEELTLENIRCFEKITLKFRDSKWITLLSQNGCGKSTALQALALLLSGPEGAQILAPRPVGWLRKEDKPGKLTIRVHQSDNDPGTYGTERITRSFGYTFHVTGGNTIEIRNKKYSEPTITENPDRILSWLRENAYTSKGKGWFAVGYGAFRRLTRRNEIIVPSLEPQARYTNFISQFDEDKPLSAFEHWMVFLDYRIAKDGDKDARRKRDIGIAAINKLLPQDVRFDSVNSEGRIIFDVNGTKVPTLAMSDGYRSILALSGDLVWRLIQAFPQSDNPSGEEGIVLIDELDIHLHPTWQREIVIWLREQFPNLQFIVATHSPLIAAGAGSDALTYRLDIKDGKSHCEKVENIHAMNVDRILQSPAFGLVSPYSPQTQKMIDRYDKLMGKIPRLSKKEMEEREQLELFIQRSRPFGAYPAPGSLENKIDVFLDKVLK